MMRHDDTTSTGPEQPEGAGAPQGAGRVQEGAAQGAGSASAPSPQGADTSSSPPEPRPPGRPCPGRAQRPDRAPRQDRLRVRVLPDEMARWRAAARAAGCKGLSTWLRALADQAAVAGDDPRAWRAELAKALRDLNAGVGGNLNALAHRVHDARRRGGDRAADAQLARADAALGAMAADLATMRARLLDLLAPPRRRRRQAVAPGAAGAGEVAGQVPAAPDGEARP